jgi:hypothetical protein
VSDTADTAHLDTFNAQILAYFAELECGTRPAEQARMRYVIEYRNDDGIWIVLDRFTAQTEQLAQGSLLSWLLLLKLSNPERERYRLRRDA